MQQLFDPSHAFERFVVRVVLFEGERGQADVRAALGLAAAVGRRLPAPLSSVAEDPHNDMEGNKYHSLRPLAPLLATSQWRIAKELSVAP